MRKTFRFHDVDDKDICDILNNSKDATKAMKYYFRRGLNSGIPILEHEVSDSVKLSDVEIITIEHAQQDLSPEQLRANLIRNVF